MAADGVYNVATVCKQIANALTSGGMPAIEDDMHPGIIYLKVYGAFEPPDEDLPSVVFRLDLSADPEFANGLPEPKAANP